MFWLIFYLIAGVLVSFILAFIKQAFSEKKYLKLLGLVILLITSIVIIGVIRDVIKSNTIPKKNTAEVSTEQTTNTKSSKKLYLYQLAKENGKSIQSPNSVVKLENKDFPSEKFSISFDFSRNLGKKIPNILCDYIDSANRNELKITIIDYPQASDDATFNGITYDEYEEYVKGVKEHFIPDNLELLGNDYVKINNDIAICIRGLQKNIAVPNFHAFIYLIHKGKKLYMFSYFTLDDYLNDTILTSLNSLKFY